jgi:hypothetical protein
LKHLPEQPIHAGIQEPPVDDHNDAGKSEECDEVDEDGPIRNIVRRSYAKSFPIRHVSLFVCVFQGSHPLPNFHAL